LSTVQQHGFGQGNLEIDGLWSSQDGVVNAQQFPRVSSVDGARGDQTRSAYEVFRRLQFWDFDLGTGKLFFGKLIQVRISVEYGIKRR
jgi:hypothetical protein